MKKNRYILILREQIYRSTGGVFDDIGLRILDGYKEIEIESDNSTLIQYVDSIIRRESQHMRIHSSELIEL